MQSKILTLVFIAVIVGAVTFILISTLTFLGAVKLGNGCFLRYNMEGTSIDTVKHTQIVNASGQYDSERPLGAVDPTKAVGQWVKSDLYIAVTKDSNGNTKPVNVAVTVDGEVSLCQAYLPKNSLTCKLKPANCDINKFFDGEGGGCKEDCDDNTDEVGQLIPIPKIDDVGKGLPVILRANTGEWRNIAQILSGDKIEVKIGINKNPAYSEIANVIEDYIYSKAQIDWLHDTSYDRSEIASNFGVVERTRSIVADCTEGKKKYSPLCGRYSPWGENDKYIKQCEECKNCTCAECGKPAKCNGEEKYCREYSTNHGFLGKRWCHMRHYCWPGTGSVCVLNKGGCAIGMQPTCWEWKDKKLDCKKPIYANLPESYLDNGSRTVPAIIIKENEEDLRSLEELDCNNPVDEFLIKNRKRVYSWRSATYATDLKFRFSASGNIDSTLGSACDSLADSFAINCHRSPKLYPPGKRVVYSGNAPTNLSGGIRYLQYTIPPNSRTNTAKNSTGGYVLYLKQSSCIRQGGAGFDDGQFKGRGKILYKIVPSGIDYNSLNSYDKSKYKEEWLDVTVKDKIGTADIKAAMSGYIWFKINNKQEDYLVSTGSYKITISSSIVRGKFLVQVLNPLIKMLKTRISEVSKIMFKNMICYQKTNKSSCTNFFNYIRAMLTLYVMGCGLLFAMGGMQFTIKELIVRVIKVVIVGGLLNESTFNFFNTYLYGLIMEFTDQLMSSMSGYTMFDAGDDVSNPFLFLDAVMSKVFFSKTFFVQVLSLFSMGLIGIVYFIMVFVTLVLIIVTLIKTITVYLMAVTAIAVLIGIAPLFLTFMLFEGTWYLFDNWVRFLFRYLIEPVVLMAGIIILTQLFTIYLDYVIGYSVCWKCVIPFKIPFIGLPFFNDTYSGIELFCINWFAPWGYDNRAGVMGLNMHYIVAMIIIAYCMYGYVELSEQIVTKLCAGDAGGRAPSATSMAAPISNKIDLGLNKVGGKAIALGTRLAGRLKAGGDGNGKDNNVSTDDNSSRNFSSSISGHIGGNMKGTAGDGSNVKSFQQEDQKSNSAESRTTNNDSDLDDRGRR